MAVIPFYGAADPEMFRIEREAMDRPGRVIAALGQLLPTGLVLDVGAGNGHTASAVADSRRRVVALEPAAGMIDAKRPLPWVRGDAAHLPFADHSFDGAYATWAYYFPGFIEIEPAVAELRRVVAPGGPLVIVDNAGGDEFCALAERDIAAPLDVWRDLGFAVDVVETAFEFETIDDASRLLRFFFGDDARPSLRVGFNVAVMVG